MMDMLRKSLLAGLGATMVTLDKAEAVLNDLVARGKLTAEEAQASASRLREESREEFARVESSMSRLFDDMLKRARLATQADLKALEKRVAELEARASVSSETTTPSI